MKEIVYFCDGCDAELSNTHTKNNRPHLSIEIDKFETGIARPHAKETDKWVIDYIDSKDYLQFCNTECMKKYFDSKLALLKTS